MVAGLGSERGCGGAVHRRRAHAAAHRAGPPPPWRHAHQGACRALAPPPLQRASASSSSKLGLMWRSSLCRVSPLPHMGCWQTAGRFLQPGPCVANMTCRTSLAHLGGQLADLYSWPSATSPARSSTLELLAPCWAVMIMLLPQLASCLRSTVLRRQCARARRRAACLRPEAVRVPRGGRRCRCW